MDREKEKSKLQLVEIRILPIFEKNINLIQLVKTSFPFGWEKFFISETSEIDELNNLTDLGILTLISEHLAKKEKSGQYISYPLRKDIFSCYRTLSPDRVKVIFLNDEPYDEKLRKGIPISDGKCFSVVRGAPIPDRLSKFFSIIENDYPKFKKPKHGDLSSLACQGVLMLNLYLTCSPKIHSDSPKEQHKFWLPFTEATISFILDLKPEVPIVCFTDFSFKIATKFKTRIFNCSGQFSKWKKDQDKCDKFIDINNYLKLKSVEPVDFSLI